MQGRTTVEDVVLFSGLAVSGETHGSGAEPYAGYTFWVSVVVEVALVL